MSTEPFKLQITPAKAALSIAGDTGLAAALWLGNARNMPFLANVGLGLAWLTSVLSVAFAFGLASEAIDASKYPPWRLRVSAIQDTITFILLIGFGCFLTGICFAVAEVVVTSLIAHQVARANGENQ